MVETAIRDLLAELETFGRENDANQQDHGKKMLNLEPETARLISILIRSGHYTRLLEIGTSNGYSTIWLAWAVRATRGHVISIDRNPAKHEMAVRNLQRAGLSEYVTLRQGDALEIIRSLQGPFDLVFFDADRLSAPKQIEALLPKLMAMALVLANNVLSHPEEIAPYLATINALPEFDHMVVPVGKGLSIAYYQRSGHSGNMLASSPGA